MKFSLFLSLLLAIGSPVHGGDGVSPPLNPNDDTELLRQLISDAADESFNCADGPNRGQVNLEPRTYYISGTLEMKPNVVLRGAGMELTMIEATHSGDSLTIQDDCWARVMNLTLKASPLQNRIVDVVHSERVDLINVRFCDLHEPASNSNPVVALRVRQNCDGLHVIGCKFENLSSYEKAVRGIAFVDDLNGELSTIQNATVKECEFRNIWSTKTPNRDADAIFVNYHESHTDLLIRDTLFVDCGKRAIKDKSGGLDIQGNTIVFNEEFYLEKDILGPASAIALQFVIENGSSPNPNAQSIVRDNQIELVPASIAPQGDIGPAPDLGGDLESEPTLFRFIIAPFTVGSVDGPVHYATIKDNTITVPDLSHLTSRPPSLNMDGVRVTDNNLLFSQHEIVITNNEFLGSYRHGVNRNTSSQNVSLDASTTFEHLFGIRLK